MGFASIDAVTAALASAGYISTPSISTALYLAHHLRKPVLVEGPAGVGKTDMAVCIARALSYPLLRLQCYEGLDESKALYEWQYGKQLLYTQVLKDKINHLIGDADSIEASLGKLAGFRDLFFSREFLAPRPVLKAMEQEGGSVLLIDEIDKSDEAFEALLLEVLADALKRSCLHLHVGFPDADREQQIVRARVPDIAQSLLKQMVDFVQSLREQDIRKLPSISETVDWARTLLLMHAEALDPALVRSTLSVLLKRQTDVISLDGKLDSLTHAAVTGPGAAS
ncbi:MAG: MoxR family ATPase [Burkholderiales bacterium]|nr:MoxR family ATPase [Burkholderiales bacterium]